MSQLKFTFETPKVLFLVKKSPFLEVCFWEHVLKLIFRTQKGPFLVRKRSLFENRGTLLMDF